MRGLLALTLLFAGILSTLRNLHELQKDRQSCAYFRGPNPYDPSLDRGRFDHGPLAARHALSLALGGAAIWTSLALRRGKSEGSPHVSLWSGAGAVGYAAAVYVSSASAFRSVDSLRAPLSMPYRASMIGSLLLDTFCGALAITLLVKGAGRAEGRTSFWGPVLAGAALAGVAGFGLGRSA